MIHIYIYINNQDNILTSGYNGDIMLFPSQTRLPKLNICDASIKYDEHFSVLDGNSYILYKYDISNMDCTSFYFYYLYINQQYHSDNYTYYIAHIDIKNNSGFKTTYGDNAPYFNAGTMYPIECPLIGKDKVTYININFTQHPRVTSTTTPSTTTPSTPDPTNKLEYKIYLNNHTNKKKLTECFSTALPHFRLNFNFSDYPGSIYTITYNFSQGTIEKAASFLESAKFDIFITSGNIDIILNSDRYKLIEITKDVSNNDLIIYDCGNTYTTTHDSLISINMSSVLYRNSSSDNKMYGYICVGNKLSTQSYLNTSYNAINTSYNSYIQ